MPDPTLCENEELDVYLDVPDVLRESDVDVDGTREEAADRTALLTAVLERGAAGLFLYGSPALSTRVLRFEGGSGTVGRESPSLFDLMSDAQLEAGRLRPY